MKSAVDEYMKFPYTIEITPDVESVFVKVKELPGCMSVGKTRVEAIEMIDDAMRAWLEVALEDGVPIPLPEAMQQERFSGKFALRLPKSLHAKLAEAADREAVSLNQHIVTLLSENNALHEIKRLLGKSSEKPRSSEPELATDIFELRPNCKFLNEKREIKLVGAL